MFICSRRPVQEKEWSFVIVQHKCFFRLFIRYGRLRHHVYAIDRLYYVTGSRHFLPSQIRYLIGPSCGWKYNCLWEVWLASCYTQCLVFWFCWSWILHLSKWSHVISLSSVKLSGYLDLNSISPCVTSITFFVSE